MKNFVLGALSLLLILGLGAGAYLLGAKKIKTTSQQRENYASNTIVQEEAQPTLTTTPTFQPSPTVNVREQIVAAITSKNTQALEGYMMDTVNIRLEASGCCGPITKEEAMAQLSYLDPAVGWDFNPTNPTIISLAANSPDYYGTNWIVGVASNEYIVSFKLNSQNKIEAYNLGSSYKLIVP